jgi:hypothetical protein
MRIPHHGSTEAEPARRGSNREEDTDRMGRLQVPINKARPHEDYFGVYKAIKVLALSSPDNGSALAEFEC